MEKRKERRRDLFVDEETCRLIHPFNSLKHGPKKEVLESKGFLYRCGYWSKKESDRLLENWQMFLNENPFIKEPLKLLEHGNTDTQRIIQETNFLLSISKTINRSVWACFSRLQRMVNREIMKTGKFSDKEDRKLRKYLKRYGPKYQIIGRKMGRSRPSVERKYSHICKDVSKGKWSEEEDNLLLRATKEVTGIDNFEQLRNMEIKWRKVSKFIPSRNDLQCRQHFLNIKKWKLVEDGKKVRWKRKHSCQLVKQISESDYEDQTDIDWNELYKDFKDVSPSLSYLQTQFYRMKSKITDFHRRGFLDIIKILKNKYLSK